MDGFFDVPAGYGDADMEMAELTERGNRYARRYRGFTEEQVQDLADGKVTGAVRWHGPKDARQSYAVLVRATDADEIGPCSFEFSVDLAATWHPTAKAARLAREGL